MSLTIYLEDSEETNQEFICNSCGNSHFHNYRENLYESNITHNLGRLAEAFDLYEPMWRPDENELVFAGQLIPILEKGLNKLLKSDPQKYQDYLPKNGWGSYEGLVEFTQNYLTACLRHPKSKIKVWR